MTQATPIIGAGQSGLAYRGQDNDGKQALLNHHKGPSAPAYAEAGIIWLDDAATPWLLKTYDGADWITLGEIDAGGNAFTPYIGSDTPGNLAALDFADIAAASIANGDTTHFPTADQVYDALQSVSVATGFGYATQATAITLGAAHAGKRVELTGAANRTWALTAAATLGASWNALVHNNSSAVLTLDPNASETIDGAATLALYPGEARLVNCTGAGFATASLRGFKYLSGFSATTSGTSIALSSLPPARKHTLYLSGVSTSGADGVIVQLGTGGAPETTGYAGSTSCLATGVASLSPTSGAQLNTGGGLSASTVYTARVEIENVTGNVWMISGQIGLSSTAFTGILNYIKTLSGPLNMVRLTTLLGSDTFDAGNVYIVSEG